MMGGEPCQIVLGDIAGAPWPELEIAYFAQFGAPVVLRIDAAEGERDGAEFTGLECRRDRGTVERSAIAHDQIKAIPKAKRKGQGTRPELAEIPACVAVCCPCCLAAPVGVEALGEVAANPLGRLGNPEVLDGFLMSRQLDEAFPVLEGGE